MSFNHFDSQGRAIMVDVSAKQKTLRTAVATARVLMQPATLRDILSGATRKGDVLGVARLAGIAASKKVPDLIPLSHPLAIHHAAIDFSCDAPRGEILVTATVRAHERTGVEMEAMVSASLAALTIYDMCKGADKAIRIEETSLEFKEGGKSGTYQRAPRPGQTAPAVVSFSGWSGSGKTTLIGAVIRLFSARGYRVGAIKHDGHRFDIDRPGKDTWLMTRAGAVVTAICDSNKQAVIRQHDRCPSPFELIAADFADVDLVIVEGWKAESPNRIEVYRHELGTTPLCQEADASGFVAVATDAPLATALPQLDLNAPETVVDYIITHYLKGKAQSKESE